MNYGYSSKAFEKAFTYTGSDLGANWHKENTFFRLWAPQAEAVQINLYASGTPDAQDRIARVAMQPDKKGTWTADIPGDLNGTYYTYSVLRNGQETEACDPYARTTGVNGKRAMVLNLASTNPENWENDQDPHAGMPFTDAVIYELHVRDLSSDPHSGIRQRGKFLGVVESGTKINSGIPTGLDHMKQLGITHLHLLPVYDYGSVDESHPELPQFNWGYDPVNFNVPEGSYSTDPYHGEVRVAEMKQMVKKLHDAGISVIMDVVYNHVYHANEFCFNQIVPNYFSRADRHGKLIDASCCGNDTASERAMVHKYIVDSVNYWADEYHIDGFRFDLVGLIDTNTIRDVMTSVHARHPSVVFYGEGWDMAKGVTKTEAMMTTQQNASLVPGFAFFNDTIRDTLRGSIFLHSEKGYISGKAIPNEDLAGCFTGHPSWTSDPKQVINYISCHDNHTLMDRITVAMPNTSREERIRRNNLGAAFCLLSQGIPFFQAGEELLRSKPSCTGELVHNSYRSSDRVNSIKWEQLNEEIVFKTFQYYRSLIAIRKAYPVLRLQNREQIEKCVSLRTVSETGLTVFELQQDDQTLLIAYNAGTQYIRMEPGCGSWDILARDDKASAVPLDTVSGAILVPPISAMVLVQNKIGSKAEVK